MKNPLVSIIVPCYKLAQYLPETLDSVLVQTYQNWECIIVNDGSPDNTEEVAKTYCAKDKRFRYFFKKNTGLSDTRNFGIKNSFGELILPLDSDDIITSVYLQKAVEQFEKHPETTLVHCEGEFFDAVIGRMAFAEYNYNTLLFENTFIEPVIYKRADYDKTNGYQVNMKKGWEDWCFLIDLLDEKSVVYKIPEVCLFYRVRKNSMMRNISENDKTALFLQMYENNRYKYNRNFPNPMYLGYLLEKEKREKEYYKNAFENLRKSKKYKIGQFLSKIKFVKK